MAETIRQTTFVQSKLSNVVSQGNNHHNIRTRKKSGFTSGLSRYY